MSTVKVNEVKHLSNTGTANIVLESNATTNLQATSTLGLTVTGTLTVSGVSTLNGNTVVGNASTDTMLLTSTVSGFNNFSGFTGEIRMYAGNAAGDDPPDGWLYCNGDTISSTSANGGTHYNLDGKGNDYQPLFNLLKATSDWGNSSSAAWGTNTIKTPDFRSRSPVGVHTGAATSITAGLTSRTLSDTVGAETHALTIAELAVHTHVTTAADSPANSNITITNPTHTHGMQNHTHTSDPHTHGDGSYSAINGGTHNHNNGSYNTILRVTGSHTVATIDSSGGSEPDLVYTSTLQQHTGHTHGVSGTSGETTPDPTGYPNNNTTTATPPGQALGGQVHTHVMTTANTGSGTPHTILSPIIAVNYIIKV